MWILNISSSFNSKLYHFDWEHFDFSYFDKKSWLLTDSLQECSSFYMNPTRSLSYQIKLLISQINHRCNNWLFHNQIIARDSSESASFERDFKWWFRGLHVWSQFCNLLPCKHIFFFFKNFKRARWGESVSQEECVCKNMVFVIRYPDICCLYIYMKGNYFMCASSEGFFFLEKY